MYKVSKVKSGSIVQFTMQTQDERMAATAERDKRRYEWEEFCSNTTSYLSKEDEANLFNPSPTSLTDNSQAEALAFAKEEQGRKDITFSEDARRRFRSSLENFCSIFNASKEHEPSLLNYQYEGKTYSRMPVFLTLTLPKQDKEDKEIKQKALNNLLQNLTKTYNVKMYIWKAEAQARGVIHFHIVIDGFVFHSKIRRLWYNALKRLDCIPNNLPLSKASKLVHMKVVKDPAKLFDELAGYFDTARDEDGKLIHKHDPNKRVRDINGRNWGCSENLKYQNFMVYDICNEFENNLYNESLKKIEITGSKGTKVAEVYITKYKLYNKSDKSFSIIQNKTYLQETMLLYHLYKAMGIYSDDSKHDYVRDWLEDNDKFKLYSRF